jgi:hypothetical protein
MINGSTSDMVELQISKICFLIQPNPWIGPQNRGQLITANVNGDHLLAATFQQNLGKATS